MSWLDGGLIVAAIVIADLLTVMAIGRRLGKIMDTLESRQAIVLPAEAVIKITEEGTKHDDPDADY